VPLLMSLSRTYTVDWSIKFFLFALSPRSKPESAYTSSFPIYPPLPFPPPPPPPLRHALFDGTSYLCAIAFDFPHRRCVNLSYSTFLTHTPPPSRLDDRFAGSIRKHDMCRLAHYPPLHTCKHFRGLSRRSFPLGLLSSLSDPLFSPPHFKFRSCKYPFYLSHWNILFFSLLHTFFSVWHDSPCGNSNVSANFFSSGFAFRQRKRNCSSDTSPS